MNVKLPLAAAFAALLALSACGGGSGSTTPAVVVASPAALSVTDTVVGTGTVAAAGNTVTVNYTGYLYSDTATGHKGAQFDTSVGKTPFEFKLASGSVIAGFDTGVTGMKVGGKRTVFIPYTLGYGAGGTSGIPGGSGLVFDLELLTVK